MRTWLLAGLLGVTATAAAGPLFPWRKTEKVDPRTRVPELLTALRGDKDEAKRSSAAVELRSFDANQYPDIVPGLIGAMLTDPRPGVRIDAAQSLGKLRPVSQAAGEAIEQAVEKDPSMRVRLQARSVLLSYQWAGYRNGGKKPEGPPAVTTSSAPEKRPAFVPPVRTASPPSSSSRPTTAEPPLAAPLPPAAPPTGDGPILP